MQAIFHARFVPLPLSHFFKKIQHNLSIIKSKSAKHLQFIKKMQIEKNDCLAKK